MTQDNESHLIVGRHPVAEALSRHPQRVQELLVGSGRISPALKRLVDSARSAGVKIRRLDRARLDSLAQGSVHQGVAARLSISGYAGLSDILSRVRSASERALVVVADHIQDPHNLGALIRSAAAAGAQGLITPKDRACPLTPAVAKAAAGALELLPVARVTNLATCLAELKENGLWLLAAATRAAPAPWELDLDLPLALIVGSEHKGVGPGLMKLCDLETSLPLAAGAESLNASVAAGAILFEILRQRQTRKA
ncbi:MAG: 23S rRNA (guanosine(2251)-2'-O)-methyltransferase RlmB [Desulfarculaceae bacterium]